MCVGREERKLEYERKKNRKNGENKNRKEEEKKRKMRKKEKEDRERKEEKEGCRVVRRPGLEEPRTRLQEVGFLLLRFISCLGAM